MSAHVRQTFGAIFREIQTGIPRLGFVRDEEGEIVAAVLAVVELDSNGDVRGHVPVAELQIPMAGMPAAA